MINAISPTYAEEIRDPWYGHGLYDFLAMRSDKLRGILCGIDMGEYDPATDASIAAQYSSSDFTRGKADCKNRLRDIFGLAHDASPVIGMATPYESYKGLDLLLHAADEIVSGGMQIAVAGWGESGYENSIREIAARCPGRFAARTDFSPETAKAVYAGSDMFLMPSRTEPCGVSMMKAMRYGAAPIVRLTGGLRDTVAGIEQNGEGYGLGFEGYSADEMTSACFRAKNIYGDAAKWRRLVTRLMSRDNGWAVPAKNYLALYEETLKLR
jgi:starch synthase